VRTSGTLIQESGGRLVLSSSTFNNNLVVNLTGPGSGGIGLALQSSATLSTSVVVSSAGTGVSLTNFAGFIGTILLLPGVADFTLSPLSGYTLAGSLTSFSSDLALLMNGAGTVSTSVVLNGNTDVQLLQGSQTGTITCVAGSLKLSPAAGRSFTGVVSVGAGGVQIAGATTGSVASSLMPSASMTVTHTSGLFTGALNAGTFEVTVQVAGGQTFAGTSASVSFCVSRLSSLGLRL
jgi:hypothetical protein